MAAWSHRAADAGLARRIAAALGVSEPLAYVLARSFADEADAERHLRPQLAHVSDPFAVGGLREAAERLVLAAAKGERIAILGDYDVDGVSSTAMLVHFLRRLGASPEYFVPRRLEEGYGLSMAALERVLAEAKPQLFVALDCGTNSKPEVDRLRAEGVDVIVVDHHVAKESRVTCTLVNPRVNDAEDAPWQTLCTAGLVFKLVHGVLKVLRLAGDERGTSIAVKDYLDLAALGTIADLVPLRTENRILAAHGLRVFDVAELPTHGGSLRIMACHAGCSRHAEGPGLAKVRADEAAASLDRDEGYQGFAPKVEAVRTGLLAFLRQAKAEGKTVAAYGAAAKGNTLLNYCGVGADLISCVVDRNPHKQGCFMPGSRIPIHDPAKLAELRPDYVLILPWNLKDEITQQMAEIRGWGGRFVIAIPALTILP